MMYSLPCLLLMIPAFTAAGPVLSQRQAYPVYGPGQFDIYANDNPFMSLSNPNVPANQPLYTQFYFRTQDGYGYCTDHDGNGGRLLHYLDGRTNAVQAPGDCNAPNSCRLVFQGDGNLVEYYNGQAVWDSQTSGRGASLHFNYNAPHMYILDGSGQLLYYNVAPTPPQGPPDPICGPFNCPGSG